MKLRWLFLGRKAMTNLDCIIKSRDITLPTKVHLEELRFSHSYALIWELDHKESWAPKNWCFCTMVLKKTLESCLDCKKIKPVNLKEISPEYSLEELMLKLKFQYFSHLMRRANPLKKTLMLGKTAGRRRMEWQRMRWLDDITDSITWFWASSGRWWRTVRPGMLQSMGLQRVRHERMTEQQQQATMLSPDKELCHILQSCRPRRKQTFYLLLTNAKVTLPIPTPFPWKKTRWKSNWI